MERPRVVFDCMIFLQAAAKSTGPAAALLELAEIGAIELLVSDDTLEELQDVLDRPSLQGKLPSLTPTLVRDFIERVKLYSEYYVNTPSVFAFDRDPKDAKYINLAFAAKADFLVTRDNDLLDLRMSDQLAKAFDQLGWRFQIVDPFELLTYLQSK